MLPLIVLEHVLHVLLGILFQEEYVSKLLHFVRFIIKIQLIIASNVWRHTISMSIIHVQYYQIIAYQRITLEIVLLVCKDL